MKSNEVWKDIEGYGGKYRISSMGRVMSMWRGNQYKEKNGEPYILKPSIHKQGYLKVSLLINGKKRIWFIHRLVALHFIDNPENLPEVNHIDENKANNKIENLEWCTGKYNSNYGTRVERHREMVSKPVIQYTVDGEFIKEYKSATAVEKETGYDSAYISLVCNGKRPKAYGYKWSFKNIHNRQQGKTTVQDVLRILADLLDENKSDEYFE